MTPQRWLVTGCSTGLGRALAEDLARSGEKVIATARRPQMLAMTHGLADSGTATPPELFAKLVRHTVALEQPPLRLPFGEGAFVISAPRWRHGRKTSKTPPRPIH